MTDLLIDGTYRSWISWMQSSAFNSLLGWFVVLVEYACAGVRIEPVVPFLRIWKCPCCLFLEIVEVRVGIACCLVEIDIDLRRGPDVVDRMERWREEAIRTAGVGRRVIMLPVVISRVRRGLN